jgi:phenylacetate-CoA ligase
MHGGEASAQQGAPGALRLVTPNLPLVGWPAFPDEDDALTLALLHQLEETQWWPADRLRAYQFGQLRLLLNFAREKSAYYRDLLDGFDLEDARNLADNLWQNIPLTRRVDIQAHSKQMRCRNLPKEHLPVTEGATSGSTGRPVTFMATQVTGTFHDALSRLQLNIYNLQRIDPSALY